MLTFVTWLWKPAPGYRSVFDAEKVNVLFRMIDRHYPSPHRNLCVTDMPKGIDQSIEVVPAWNDFANISSPHGSHQPSCYRRLRAFHPEIGKVFGLRFVSLDLDTVVTGDLVALFDRPEDFVVWGETNKRSWYNGSLWMMNAGARPKVWNDFNPKRSPYEAKHAGRFGSDQGWISHCLGKGEATWGRDEGVYSFRVHLDGGRLPLPANAKLVMWHGKIDPWSNEGMKLDWVREHYR